APTRKQELRKFSNLGHSSLGLQECREFGADRGERRDAPAPAIAGLRDYLANLGTRFAIPLGNLRLRGILRQSRGRIIEFQEGCENLTTYFAGRAGFDWDQQRCQLIDARRCGRLGSDWL